MLEHFGTPCELPEAKITGYCEVCKDEIYYDDETTCECGSKVHLDCMKTCEQCDTTYCKDCMTKTEDGYFCKSPDDETKSDCYNEWKTERMVEEILDILFDHKYSLTARETNKYTITKDGIDLNIEAA